MIVVADTSPVCYLVLIEHSSVLPRLYGRILVTAAVLAELRHPQAPAPVRQWAETPPDWLEIHPNPASPAVRPVRLHSGEHAALLLAQHLRADFVLMDEAAGREAARDLGVKVVGTFGVLRDAADVGMIDFRESLLRLRSTSFRASPALWDALLGPS